MIATALGNLAALTIDPLHPKDPGLAKLFGFNRQTTAGVSMTPDKALGYPPFWRGVNILCNGVSKPRLKIYERIDDDSRRVAREHPAYHVMSRRPNPLMGSGEFRKLLQLWALTYGNGCAWIRRNEAAEPIELWPLLPDRTTAHVVDRNGNPAVGTDGDGTRVVYVSTVGGERVPFASDDVLHIKGLSWAGFTGYPVVEMLKESLGLGIAAGEYGSRFFGNGATASGIIMAPPGMRQEQMQEYARSIRQGSEGLGKAHRLMVLGSGTEFKQMSIPPEHAQFLQTREYQAKEVGLILGVQTHKLGDSTRTSYSSLEQSNQEHLDDDIDPLLATWEEQCGRKLLTEEQQFTDSHYFEFNRDSLIRVNAQARAVEFSTGRQWGYLSANDIRKAKNLPPIEGGDVYLSPANMVPTHMLGTMTAPPMIEDEEEEPGDSGPGVLELALIEHEQSRLRSRVAKAAAAAAKRGPKEYGAFLERIPSWAGQPECIAEQLQAVAAELSESFGAFAEAPYTSSNFAEAVTQESERLLSAENHE